MIEYVYIVKCPNCEDEHFHFFDEAKTCAMGALSSKPIITQVEVNRNDFGECTDSCDLGTVWSWEDAVGKETEAEPEVSVFNKGDFNKYTDDSEFDDDEFYFDNGLVEDVAQTRVSFKNKEDFDEFSKLCSEIGIITGSDLKKFMDEVGADDGNLLDKLRAYRAELGDDFEITEDVGRFEYSGRHYDPVTVDTKEFGFELNKPYLIIDSKDLAKANGAKIVPESVVCPADKIDSPENYFVKFSRDSKPELMDLQTFAIFMKNAEKQIVECSERKPIPEGMTIEELVEEMEENEDTVECTWCNDLFDKSECRKEVDLGWLCGRCEAAIKSRGETLTFREGNYWDFLDESAAIEDSTVIGKHVRLVENGVDMNLTTLKQILKINREYALPRKKIDFIVTFDNDCIIRQETELGYLITIPCYYRNPADRSKILERPEYHLCWISKKYCEIIELDENLDESVNETRSFAELVKDSINHLTNDLGKDPWAEDFVDDVIADIENNYNVDVPDNQKQYNYFCSAVASEVSWQLNNNSKEDPNFDDFFNQEF